MTRGDFVPRHIVALEKGVGFVHPRELPEMVQLQSPALDVMTDFKVVRPVTTKAHITIDRAVEGMKSAGVRLLLVTDDDDHVIGVITANDVQGEKAIRIMEENRVPRGEVTVAMTMTPQSKITALDMRSVVDSQVGHIVCTLDELERQHILVVEVDPDTSKQTIRGLFSTSQISKQLGRPVEQAMHAAHSLLEMVHEVA